MNLRSHTRRALGVTGVVVVVVALGAWMERSVRADNVPYVPASADAVVERLPKGREALSEIERLRVLAAAAPGDPARAADLAERCIREARRTGDPRYLGQARAALAPFAGDVAAPPRLVLLRATIAQSLHDFDAALRDLDALVVATPRDPQVWLTRGVVLYVVGRHEEARGSCDVVASLGEGLAALVCRATIDSVSGHARGAYDALGAALSRGSVTPSEEAWARSTLGEIAVRAGDDAAAERHFRAALALDPDDAYSRAALADLLLDLGRPREVAAVVDGRTDDDGLLLRLAIAAARSGAADRDALAETLGQRHAASLARGDVVHRREQARFELEVRGDAARALALAEANFGVQREPWDARILFAAALAAKKPEAARAALEFVRSTRSEEPRLVALAARVASARSAP